MEKPDIRTKRQREDIILNLTDRQYGMLHGIAYEHGFRSPAELLEGFIADLTRTGINNTDAMFEAQTWLQMAYAHKTFNAYYFREFLYDVDLAPRDIKILSKAKGIKNLFKEIYKDYIETEAEKRHESKKECMDILKEWSNEPTERTNIGTEAHHPGSYDEKTVKRLQKNKNLWERR